MKTIQTPFGKKSEAFLCAAMRTHTEVNDSIEILKALCDDWPQDSHYKPVIEARKALNRIESALNVLP